MLSCVYYIHVVRRYPATRRGFLLENKTSFAYYFNIGEPKILKSLSMFRHNSKWHILNIYVYAFSFKTDQNINISVFHNFLFYISAKGRVNDLRKIVLIHFIRTKFNIVPGTWVTIDCQKRIDTSHVAMLPTDTDFWKWESRVPPRMRTETSWAWRNI